MKTRRIAVIGAGNMARALIGGWRAAGVDGKLITVIHPRAQALAQIAQVFQVCTAQSAAEGIATAEVVVIAVKPQQVPGVLAQLHSAIKQHQPLLLSVAAGIRTEALIQSLQGYAQVVRAMPNRPALLGLGITALFAPLSVTSAEREAAQELLQAVGQAVWVHREEQMDTVTAISGSGPAYFFLLMETLEEIAHELGLPADIARKLSIETAYGAAAMARGSAAVDRNAGSAYCDPSQLRIEVTSPGGTTEAALNVLSSADWRGIVRRAVTAAAQRSAALAQELGHR